MKIIATLNFNNKKENIYLDEEINIFWIGEGKQTITSEELLQKYLSGDLSWINPPTEVVDNTVEQKNKIFTANNFLSVKNCNRALYYLYHNLHQSTEHNDYLDLLAEDGLKVRELGYQLYSGGKYIYGGKQWDSVEDTITALKKGEDIIYGGRVQRNDEYIYSGILPILVRDTKSGGYKLISTTTSTKLKEDKHILRMGYLRWLAMENDLPITSYELLTPNKEFLGGNGLDLTKYFVHYDITEQVQETEELIWQFINRIPEVVNGKEPPADFGVCCSKCQYKSFCFSSLPEHHIFTLPRITSSKKTLEFLKENNIYDIKLIPDNLKLSENQQRRKYCVEENRIIASKDALSILKNLPQPIHFIDFETFPMVVPKFSGMKPHQNLPFQWSNHILNNNELTHDEYLDSTGGDCREEFLITLIESCRNAATIAIYSPFETARLRELEKIFPQHADEIEEMINKFFDLEKFISTNIDHPQFYGRTSIKVVLPALYPKNLYAELPVHNGTGAITAYSKMIQPGIKSEEKLQIRKELLDYCGLDTKAMVIIYNKLLELLEKQY